MNIYEFAMQMEKDGENYYRELAELSKDSGLGKIFTMLAEDEVYHYKLADRLNRRQKEKPVDSKILENVKNIFVSMKEIKEEIRIDTTKAAEQFRKACTIEERSRDFYQEKADQAEDQEEKEIFLQLAEWEGRHLRIMENIVEFVSRPEPGNWLENAEWHHLDEY
jgi:rubrerythrin